MTINRLDPEVQQINAHVTHEVVDHRKDSLEQLRTLKALNVPREKLEALFGYSGLPMLEKQLAEEDKTKPIDAEFTEIERDVDFELLGDV